jgi:hypothetical protein
MEKVHAKAKVTPDLLTFLAEMQSDSDNFVQAMSDLRTGWESYLITEMKVSDDRDTGATALTSANPAKYSKSIRRARNSTPTEREEGAVCSLQCLHQHAGR